MKELFVPYEQALALKELDFDEPCFTYYHEDTGRIRTGLSIHIHNAWTYSGTKRLESTLAPTYTQAFRFFREKHNLKSWVQEHTADTFIYEIRPHKLTDYREGEVYVYEKYEQAELACLRKLIEIVKKN